ncbi:MAG: hypothetical protein ACYC6Y_22180, partial [Thermoguttaceae bacterium]
MRSLPSPTGSLAVLLVLLVSMPARAQTVNAPPPTTADLQQQIAELRRSIDATSGTVTQHSDQIERLTNLIDSIVGKLDRQEKTLADQSAQIESLKTGMDTVTTNLRQQIG